MALALVRPEMLAGPGVPSRRARSPLRLRGQRLAFTRRLHGSLDGRENGYTRAPTGGMFARKHSDAVTSTLHAVARCGRQRASTLTSDGEDERDDVARCNRRSQERRVGRRVTARRAADDQPTTTAML